MGLNKLVEAALIIVLCAAAAGQLPRLVQTDRYATILPQARAIHLAQVPNLSGHCVHRRRISRERRVYRC